MNNLYLWLRVQSYPKVDDQDVLAGNAKTNEAVRKSGTAGLWLLPAGLVLAAMILASAFLARSADGGEMTTTNVIALAVFVVAIVIALSMLGRILWQSHRLRQR